MIQVPGYDTDDQSLTNYPKMNDAVLKRTG